MLRLKIFLSHSWFSVLKTPHQQSFWIYLQNLFRTRCPISISTATTLAQAIPGTCLYWNSFLPFASTFSLQSTSYTAATAILLSTAKRSFLHSDFSRVKVESLNWPTRPYKPGPCYPSDPISCHSPPCFLRVYHSWLFFWIHQAHLPQDLCACFSLWLGPLPPHVHIAHTLTFYRSVFKCYLTREAFPDHPL